MKCPIPQAIGCEVKTCRSAGQDLDGVLPRLMHTYAIHQLKKMAMQMNRMRHHRAVDQNGPHPFHVTKNKRFRIFTELGPIEGPHIPFHVGGKMYLERTRWRPLVRIRQ